MLRQTVGCGLSSPQTSEASHVQTGSSCAAAVGGAGRDLRPGTEPEPEEQNHKQQQ